MEKLDIPSVSLQKSTKIRSDRFFIASRLCVSVACANVKAMIGCVVKSAGFPACTEDGKNSKDIPPGNPEQLIIGLVTNYGETYE